MPLTIRYCIDLLFFPTKALKRKVFIFFCFLRVSACPVAPRGKPGLKPADGTGVKFAAATVKRI